MNNKPTIGSMVALNIISPKPLSSCKLKNGKNASRVLLREPVKVSHDRFCSNPKKNPVATINVLTIIARGILGDSPYLQRKGDLCSY